MEVTEWDFRETYFKELYPESFYLPAEMQMDFIPVDAEATLWPSGNNNDTVTLRVVQQKDRKKLNLWQRCWATTSP